MQNFQYKLQLMYKKKWFCCESVCKSPTCIQKLKKTTVVVSFAFVLMLLLSFSVQPTAAQELRPEGDAHKFLVIIYIKIIHVMYSSNWNSANCWSRFVKNSVPKAVHHRKFLERRDPEDIGKQYSQAAYDSLSKNNVWSM